MYEDQFQLKRRPFAATPDPRCFLAVGQVRAALDEVVVCAEQGQGVAIVSAPAGTGKTLLCERLKLELEDRFQVVILRHASFLTRRALLQTILAELNHAYRRHEEQELRLELVPAIRALQPSREALVLICDEAHLLTEDLLEELRILSDLAELGHPLVRLVLVGQPGLEETLAGIHLQALNQRIRAHVYLDAFDRVTSREFLDYRVTWAGGRLDEVFTPEAVEFICRVSQGVPRCMNQLCDHSLLLAYVAEQRPVTIETIEEALRDLRQLPLQWNESLHSSARTATHSGVESPAPARDDASVQGYEVLEVGADLPGAAVRDAATPVAATSADTDPNPCVVEFGAETLCELPSAEHSPVPAGAATEFPGAVQEVREEMSDAVVAGEPCSCAADRERAALPDCVATEITPARQVIEEEELVCDRYAAIDGGFALPVGETIFRRFAETVAAEPSGTASEDALQPVVSEHGHETVASETEVEPPTVTDAVAASHETESIPQHSEVHESTADSTPETDVELTWALDDDEQIVTTVEVPCVVEPFEAVCARLEELLPETVLETAWSSEEAHHLIEQVTEAGLAIEDASPLHDDADSQEARLSQQISELIGDVQAAARPLDTPKPSSADVLESVYESHVPEATTTDRPGRPYRNLFSQLRRKQQGLA